MKNTIILLTGATGGIGRALADALAKKGAILVLVGRHLNALHDLKEQLVNDEHHQIIEADIGAVEGRDKVNQHARWLGQQGTPIEILINNAGVNSFNYLSMRADVSIEHEIAINLTAPILLCKQALTWLAPTGLIVNIGSTFAGIGFPGYANYGATKSGLYRFTEALNRELHGTQQCAIYIAPRATKTALNDARATAMNKQLRNHVDSPEWVANHIIRAIEKRCFATWLGWPEKLFVRLNQLFPSLVGHGIAKQKDIIDFHANTPQGLPVVEESHHDYS
ncbi:short chain dehydrogenase [Salinivibrio sp. MA351]|uniref:SDR family oxidoreductase n=1 Tax=Salinivibrio sp. MA351 TaxID=1909453 RepID=UPI000988DB6B|nr:SDR family oxidoreductase [Salinivibrio sp. MA351]OOE98948.1 short chain dehydrogenase [Salinivibrio sp. MA351]